MDPEPELFEDLPRAAKQQSGFGEVRVDDKILPFAISFWKDGRRRGDLSPYGLRPVVSRNERSFWEEVIRQLQERFSATIVEVVSDVRESESMRPERRRVRK